jgi:hypothetical protein
MGSRRDPVVQEIRRTRSKLSRRLSAALRAGRFEQELRKIGGEARRALLNGKGNGVKNKS